MRYLLLLALFAPLALANFEHLTEKEKAFADELLKSYGDTFDAEFIKESLLSYRRDSGVKEPELDGRTLLQICVTKIDIGAIKELLRLGADPNSTGRFGTALDLAMERNYGNANVAAMLLRHGANANQRLIGSARLPIAEAALRRNSRWIAVLLKRGADPNAEVTSGRSVLREALELGDLSAAFALIAGGARFDTDARFPKLTILGMAVYGSAGDLVRLLLLKGADPSTPISAHTLTSPFEYAVNLGRVEEAKAFLISGFAVDESLMTQLCDESPLPIIKAVYEASPGPLRRFNANADPYFGNKFVELLEDESQFVAFFVSALERILGQQTNVCGQATDALVVALSHGLLNQAKAIITQLQLSKLSFAWRLNGVLPYVSVLSNTDALQLMLKQLNFEDYPSRAALRQALVNAIRLNLNAARTILVIKALQVQRDEDSKNLSRADTINVAFLLEHLPRIIGQELADAARERRYLHFSDLRPHATDADRRRLAAEARTRLNAAAQVDNKSDRSDPAVAAAIAASAAAMPAPDLGELLTRLNPNTPALARSSLGFLSRE